MVPTVVTSWCHTVRIDLHQFALKLAEVGQGSSGQETQQAPVCAELKYYQCTTCVEIAASTGGGTRTLMSVEDTGF